LAREFVCAWVCVRVVVVKLTWCVRCSGPVLSSHHGRHRPISSATANGEIRTALHCTALPTHANANGTHCLSVSTVYFAPFPHTWHHSYPTHLWHPLVLPPCSTALNALTFARTHQCDGWPYGAQCVQGPYHACALEPHCSHVARQRQHSSCVDFTRHFLSSGPCGWDV
jgi:hypothetical protein